MESNSRKIPSPAAPGSGRAMPFIKMVPMDCRIYGIVEESTVAELRKEDLWVMADKLRNNMDSAEYKHVCLGLIFLKYISDSFDRAYQEIMRDEYADP